jgi:phage anti-repressor protein
MNSITTLPLKASVIAGESIPTVDARGLHEWLEVDTQFTKWFQRRVEEYGFSEGQDFLSILTKSTGGRPSTEYHITLDMAKELAMVERTAKGKEVRRYFISLDNVIRATAKGMVGKEPYDIQRIADMESQIKNLEQEFKKLHGTLGGTVGKSKDKPAIVLDFKDYASEKTAQKKWDLLLEMIEEHNILKKRKVIINDEVLSYHAVSRDGKKQIVISTAHPTFKKWIGSLAGVGQIWVNEGKIRSFCGQYTIPRTVEGNRRQRCIVLENVA